MYVNRLSKIRLTADIATPRCAGASPCLHFFDIGGIIKKMTGKDVLSMNKIITIGRQFGSGGRDIGKLAAEKLGFAFYDRDLISIAAEKSGMSKAVLTEADEKAA